MTTEAFDTLGFTPAALEKEVRALAAMTGHEYCLLDKQSPKSQLTPLTQSLATETACVAEDAGYLAKLAATPISLVTLHEKHKASIFSTPILNAGLIEFVERRKSAMMENDSLFKETIELPLTQLAPRHLNLISSFTNAMAMRQLFTLMAIVKLTRSFEEFAPQEAGHTAKIAAAARPTRSFTPSSYTMTLGGAFPANALQNVPAYKHP